MTRGRLIVLAVSIAGLCVSAWTARPIDTTSLPGWLLAVLWASAAWVFLCVAVCAQLPMIPAIGALVALVLFELIVHMQPSQDPLFLPVKPFYELPIATIAAMLFGYLAHRTRPDA